MVPEWLQRARALQRQGRTGDALEAFQTGLAQHPDDGEPWYEYGYLLKLAGRYRESLDAFGNAVRRTVSRPEEVHLNRAVLYSDHLRRDDEAEAELRAALALAPDYVPALLNLGNLQEERGQRDQAIATYESLLERPESHDPEHNHLRLEGLARIAHIRPPASMDDPLFQRLRDAAETQPNKTVRADLLFALGHSYERLGAYDLAFDAFAKANRWLLRQSGRRYDPAHTEALVDALIAAFPAPSPRSTELSSDSAAPQPMFICGMFRSGSTLIEQILGAHPRITAGGELNWLRRLASIDLAPFPQSMPGSDDTRLQVFADAYLAHLSDLFPEANRHAYITDKRPDNFLLIGLIKRMFPAAKIVHTQRNPLDTGLSVFSHHLHPQVANYACDLGDIGHYFAQYQRLMAHWHVLYPDDILNFDYDVFVADPEPSLHRLLRFLGLDWDARCLEFHSHPSTVKTASYWQIRQPLHRRASGRSQHFSAHLEPMRRALLRGGVVLEEDAATRFTVGYDGSQATRSCAHVSDTDPAR
jgi:cytochrome c-type biogenesis protein CcmH/NrfG